MDAVYRRHIIVNKIMRAEYPKTGVWVYIFTSIDHKIAYPNFQDPLFDFNLVTVSLLVNHICQRTNVAIFYHRLRSS